MLISYFQVAGSDPMLGIIPEMLGREIIGWLEEN